MTGDLLKSEVARVAEAIFRRVEFDGALHKSSLEDELYRWARDILDGAPNAVPKVEVKRLSAMDFRGAAFAYASERHDVSLEEFKAKFPALDSSWFRVGYSYWGSDHNAYRIISK